MKHINWYLYLYCSNHSLFMLSLILFARNFSMIKMFFFSNNCFTQFTIIIIIKKFNQNSLWLWKCKINRVFSFYKTSKIWSPFVTGIIRSTSNKITNEISFSWIEKITHFDCVDAIIIPIFIDSKFVPRKRSAERAMRNEKP